MPSIEAVNLEDQERQERQMVTSGKLPALMQKLPNPGVIPDFWPMKGSQRRRPSLKELQVSTDPNFLRTQRSHWYADQVERAFFTNRGDLPLTWLVEQHEEDLKFFTDPNFMPEIAKTLRGQSASIYYAKQNQRKLEEEANSYYMAEIKKASIIDGFFEKGFFRSSIVDGWLGATEEEKNAARADNLRPLLEARLEGKQFRQEDIDKAHGILSSDEQFNEDLIEFISTGLKGIGDAFTWGLRGASLVVPGPWTQNTIMHLLGPETSARLFNYAPEETAEIQMAKDELLKLQTGDNSALKEQLLNNEIPQIAWQQLQVENPTAYQEYLEMYGTPEMAFMGFAFEFQDLVEDPGDDQLDKWVQEGYVRPQQEMIDQLKDQNFRNAEDILEGMAWWNEMTTGAAAASVAFVSEGLEGNLTGSIIQDYKTIAERAEAGDHTPAGVLGLDGTALGFGINFFLPMAFDPTTYLFGPRMGFGANHISSSAAAVMSADNAMTKAVVSDMATTVLATDRVAAGKAAAVAPWIEVGLAGDFLGATGLVDDFFPAHQWANSKLGSSAHHVAVGRVESILDDVQVAAIDEMNPATVEQTANSLKNNGFLEPVVIAYDRTKGTLFLEEGGGLKRIAAIKKLIAEGAPIKSIPVVIREYRPPKPTPLATKVAENSHDYVFHSTTIPKAEKIQAEGMRGGGLTDMARAEEYGYIGLENGTPQKVLVFERSQFPSNIQKALADTGDHVNDLQSVVDMTSIPKIRPVAVYDLDKGVMSIGQPVGPVGKTFAELGIEPPKQTLVWNNTTSEGKLLNPRQLFDSETLGLEADPAKLEALTLEGLKNGMDLSAVRQSSIANSAGHLVRQAMDNRAFQAIEPYFATSFAERRLRMSGGLKGAVEMTQFLSAKHPEWANSWLIRLLENQRALNAAKSTMLAGSTELGVLRQLQRALQDRAAGSNGWGQAVERGLYGEMKAAGIDTQGISFKNIGEAHQVILDRIRAINGELRVQSYADQGARTWSEFFSEMMDDYNRKYIATNPEWAADVDPATGMVPWGKIHRGTDLSEHGFPQTPVDQARQRNLQQSISDTIRDEAEKADFTLTADPEMLVQGMRGYSGNVDAVVLPATPLELMAATTWGGTKFTQWSQQAGFAVLRANLLKLDALWKANLLFSPRLLATLSVDELLSMANEFGPEFLMRYLEGRAVSVEARFADLFKNRGFRTTRGSEALGESALRKLRTLDDIPTDLRQYQNSIFEALHSDILILEKGDPNYARAAQTYVQRNLENPALRAYLGGEDAFRAWLETPEGESWILNNKFQMEDGNFRYAADFDEAWSLIDLGWRYLQGVAVREGADPTKFKQAWVDAAAESGSRTGRAAPIAPYVYEYLGPIEGSRPVYPGSSVGWSWIGNAFEKFADKPAYWRQSLLAGMMRKAETARLRALFESQGKRIMSDAEVLRHFQDRGLPAGAFDPLHAEWLDQEMVRSGMVTDAYISRLAENRARDTVNNMTYSFSYGSRAGKNTGPIFTFGRAWADMWLRWARSLASENILRPWVQNLPGGKQLQNMMRHLPFNVRTASRLSRLANTSLEITGGFAGEQETDLDFSPLLFLPTESGGVNVLVPNLGWMPLLGADKMIEMFGPDPTEDPIGFQDLLDSMSDYVPGAGLYGRDELQRLMGSGFMGLMLNTANDLGMGLFHNPSRFNGLWTGNLSSELRRSRAVSAQFADEEFMESLLASTDPDTATALIMAAWKDGNTHAMQVNLFDNFSSWVVPVSGALDSSLDTLYGTWIDVGRSYPDFFSMSELSMSDQALQSDPALVKGLGDDVRRAFWKLEPWEREMIVATNPTLAANLITTWEWSGAAPMDLPGRDVPYRFGVGDTTTQAQTLGQHSAYVRMGWVRPRDTSSRGYEIVGRAITARQNSATTLYESAAAETNEFLWANVVTPETKDMLDNVLASFPVFDRVGITDPKELWLKWGSQRDRVLDRVAELSGLDPLSEEGIKLREQVLAATAMPEIEEAWSTDWQGDDVENFSARSKQFPVLFTEQTERLAAALGIDVEEGMNGEAFIAEIINYRSENEGAAWNAVRYKYTEYTEARGRSYSLAESALNDLSQNTTLDPEWRGYLMEFIDWSAAQGDRNYEEGGISRAIQDEAVRRFMALATTGRDAPVNWEKLWRDGFETVYGPLKWEAPEPPSPFDADGELSEQAWMPYLRGVVDGDTIEVSSNLGPSVFPGAMRLGETGMGETRVHKVRLLGVMAEDFSVDSDGATSDMDRLEQALIDAQKNGDTIYLVRDPDYAGSNVDPFGRELAWLWIGDEPYYFPDELKRGT